MAKLNGTIQDFPALDSNFNINDYKTFFDAQDKAFAKLQETAKKATPKNPVGAIIRFPVADGYALYRVDSIKPLTLSHIPYGDAWEIPLAHIRGLTLKDVHELVQREAALKKLFG